MSLKVTVSLLLLCNVYIDDFVNRETIKFYRCAVKIGPELTVSPFTPVAD